MEIQVKELESCKLSVHYVADAGQILNKRGEVLTAFKKAPVPGFRQGKASLDAIKSHYKQQIEESLKRALLEDAYHNTLFEKKLKPHGAPKFNSALMNDGKFSCEFELYTKPDFEVSQYNGLEVPRPHRSTNEAELCEKMLQELRVRFGEISSYSEDDFIQMGDNVILDYEATINGERVDALCAQGEMLTVGSGTLSSIDDNILGMKVGETRQFNLVVPEASLPSLSGKDIAFKVTLNTGSKTTPHPLDDQLAEKLGMKNFQDLRTFVKSAATGKLANADKTLLRDAVVANLVENTKVDVPNWMTLSEAQYLAQQSKLDWTVLPDEDKEKFMSMAEKNVKLSLILDKVREVEPGAQLTDQEVFSIIKDNLSKTQVKASLDDVIKEMSRTGYLQILFSRIRDENALDYIVGLVKVVD